MSIIPFFRFTASYEELKAVSGEACPAWDGEDDRIDIKKLSKEELAQFSNLKTVARFRIFSEEREKELQTIWLYVKMNATERL
ncbi:MAG: hypothetical protein KH452_13745 [Clostridiales bacterium]|nr:hypothetical protein [Clostridiales bacterium]